MLAVGVAAFLAAAAGIAVPATHGTWTTADEPQYLLTAISLAEDGDLDIADELAAGRWRPFHALPLPEQTRPLPGGRRLSPHDPLLPLLLAGPVAAGGWVGAKLAMAAMAGLLAALLVWTAVRRFGVPVPAAALAAAVLACSAPLAVYGSQLYPELPAALAVLAGVAAVAGQGPPGWRATLVAAGAVVALPWLSVKYVPVAAALALVAAGRLLGAGRWRRLLGLAAVLALAGAAFLVLHRRWYGGWTPYAAGDHFVGGELTVVGTEPDYLGRSRRLLGLLVDRSFGLAAWQPAWLLAVPALAVAGGVGVAAFAWLVTEGAAGHVTWAVDFADTANPLYRAWRLVLPDYLAMGWWTWTLHGAWLVALAALAAAAAGRWAEAGRPAAARLRSPAGGLDSAGPLP